MLSGQLAYTYAKELDLANINGYTGMGVSLIIMIIGVYMVINIQKHLEKDENNLQ